MRIALTEDVASFEHKHKEERTPEAFRTGFRALSMPRFTAKAGERLRVGCRAVRQGKAEVDSIIEMLYAISMVDLVTLSSKYQVVIPRSVRARLGLKPGMKLQVIEYEGRVEFLPVRRPSTLRGFLRGMSTDIERENGDRL